MASSYVINAGIKFSLSSSNIKPIVSSLEQQLRSNPLTLPVNLDFKKLNVNEIAKYSSAFRGLSSSLSDIGRNAKMGAAGVDSLTASLRMAQASIAAFGKGGQNLASPTAQVQKMTAAVDETGAAFKRSGREAISFAESVGITTRRFGSFLVSATAIYAVTASFAAATKAALDFDYQMTRLKQTGGTTDKAIADIGQTIADLSTKMGASSADLSKTAVTLKQAGLTARDTKIALEALAKTTLSPSFESLGSTTEGVIAILNQFKQGAGALEKQLGAIAQVSADFPVESGDLIEAVKRMGGAFKNAGGSLEELLGLFTSVRGTTRESAESIATGMRTILSRLEDPAIAQKLRQIGVEVYDLGGQFIGPYKAVEKLHDALLKLPATDIRVSQVIKDIGGLRQLSRVTPLIYEFPKAKQAQESAANGGDKLNKDAKDAQEALLVQINRVKESFLDLFRVISTDSSTKFVLGTIASSIRLITDALRELKPLIPVITLLGTIGTVRYFAKNVGGVGQGLFHPKTGYAKGGNVPATAGSGISMGTDTVPAMLTPGEYVLTKPMVQQLGGYSFLEGMRRKASGGNIEKRMNRLSYKFSPEVAQLAIENQSRYALTKGKQPPGTEFTVGSLRGYTKLQQRNQKSYLTDLLGASQLEQAGIEATPYSLANRKELLSKRRRRLPIDFSGLPLCGSSNTTATMAGSSMPTMTAGSSMPVIRQPMSLLTRMLGRFQRRAGGGLISGIINKLKGTPVSSPEQLEMLQGILDQAGIKIKVSDYVKDVKIGKKGLGTSLGEYNPKGKTIQVRKENDVETLLHEFGHAVDNISGDTYKSNVKGHPNQYIAEQYKNIPGVNEKAIIGGGGLNSYKPNFHNTESFANAFAANTLLSVHDPQYVEKAYPQLAQSVQKGHFGGISNTFSNFFNPAPSGARKNRGNRSSASVISPSPPQKPPRPPIVATGGTSPIPQDPNLPQSGRTFIGYPKQVNGLFSRPPEEQIPAQPGSFSAGSKTDIYGQTHPVITPPSSPNSSLPPIPLDPNTYRSNKKKRGNVGVDYSGVSIGNTYPLVEETSGSYKVGPVKSSARIRPSQTQTSVQGGQGGHRVEPLGGTPFELDKQATTLQKAINTAKNATKKTITSIGDFFKQTADQIKFSSLLGFSGSSGPNGSNGPKGPIGGATGQFSAFAPKTAPVGGIRGFLGKGGTNAALGLAIAAPYLQETLAGTPSKAGYLGIKGNRTSTVAGGALAGAAVGATLGSSFGPIGVAIGVLGGAAIGAASSLRSFNESLDNAHIEHFTKQLEESSGKLNFSTGKFKNKQDEQSFSDSLKQLGKSEDEVVGRGDTMKFLSGLKDNIFAAFDFNPGETSRLDQNKKNEENRVRREPEVQILSGNIRKIFEKNAGTGSENILAKAKDQLDQLSKIGPEGFKAAMLLKEENAGKEKLNAIVSQLNKSMALTATELEVFGGALKVSSERFHDNQAFGDISSSALQGKITAAPSNMTIDSLGGIGSKIAGFAKQGGGFDQSQSVLTAILNDVGSKPALQDKEAVGQVIARFKQSGAGGEYTSQIEDAIREKLSGRNLSADIAMGRGKNLSQDILETQKPVREEYEIGNQRLQEVNKSKRAAEVDNLNRQFELSQKENELTEKRTEREIATSGRRFDAGSRPGIIGYSRSGLLSKRTIRNLPKGYQDSQKYGRKTIYGDTNPEFTLQREFQGYQKPSGTSARQDKRNLLALNKDIPRAGIPGSRVGESPNEYLRRKGVRSVYSNRIVDREEQKLNQEGILEEKGFREQQGRFGVSGLSADQIKGKIDTTKAQLDKDSSALKAAQKPGSGKTATEIDRLAQAVHQGEASLKGFIEGLNITKGRFKDLDIIQKKYSAAVDKRVADENSRKSDAEVLAFGSQEEKFGLMQRENITQQAITLGQDEFSNLPDEIKKIVYERLKESGDQVRTIQKFDKYGRENGGLDVSGNQALAYFRQPSLNQLNSAPGARNLRNSEDALGNALDARKKNPENAEQALNEITSKNIVEQQVKLQQNFQEYLVSINQSIARQLEATNKFLANSATLAAALEKFPHEIIIKREGTVQVVLNGVQGLNAIKGDMESFVYEQIGRALKTQQMKNAIQQAVKDMPAR